MKIIWMKVIREKMLGKRFQHPDLLAKKMVFSLYLLHHICFISKAWNTMHTGKTKAIAN
jgi:hypothetical protein